MPQIVPFSIPVGNTLDVSFTVPSDIDPGAVIHWAAFPQSCGVPDKTNGPLIEKDTGSLGGVTILGSPPDTFVVSFAPGDTGGLYPGNAYHEALAIDGSGNATTVVIGIMTITEAQLNSTLSPF